VEPDERREPPESGHTHDAGRRVGVRGVGGGPSTAEGKAVSRWNAARHGINSPTPVVPGIEKKEDWEAHRGAILESLSPVGGLEHALGERVALSLWRLHRVARYETEAASLMQETVEDDLHQRRLITEIGNPYRSTHPEDVRGEARHDKAVHRSLSRFPSRRAEEMLKPGEATNVVFGVYVAARKASSDELDVEGLELPGVPEDATIEELPAMSARDVRGCVEAFASAVGLAPDELLEYAERSAAQDARSAKMSAARTEAELDAMRRRRILPGEETLQKVARYEAHISRQLYQALHELESLQKRRTTGEGAPLARLEVNGGSGS
jgi:hypothetical protein